MWGEPPLDHLHLPPNFTGFLVTSIGNFPKGFVKIGHVDLFLIPPNLYKACDD